MKISALFFIVFISSCPSFAQTDFKFDLKNNDPTKDSTQISNERKVVIHRSFLDEAIDKKDTTLILYGLFYLYVDYYNLHDYEALEKNYEQSEKLIQNIDNPAWEAAVKMRKAHLLELFDDDVQGALNEYLGIYDICVELNDSLCIAESLEQLGDLSGQLKDLTAAESYYLKAIGLMKKIDSKPELAMTYHNYGLLLSRNKKLTKAEQYLEKAIQLTQENNDLLKETRYKSNLAYTFKRGGKYDTAIKLYLELIETNKKNGWDRNLLLNYTGIADSYEQINNLRKTNDYTHAYYQLNDSLNDVKVKTEIQKLRLEMDVDKKELQIQKDKELLLEGKRKNERLLWLLFLSALTLAGFGYYIYMKERRRKEDQIINLEHLKNLKSVIEKKNLLIAEQKSQIENNTKHHVNGDSISPEEEMKLFELRMTTDEDISTFKVYFDKAYPNFLMRARNKWPSITPSEERMLMLLKLNITSKECSDILGISYSSVKKSRYRLRKRLGLGEETNLNSYVSSIER